MGKLIKVLSAEHHQPGKGASFY
ncbi:MULTISPECIES: hypothetical protein [Pediococcus]|nr:hypothetical protein PI20285_05675 [Pediococcus inopinatus]PIO82022.1 hypothetical protein BSQ38_01040 [Pediococcus damnosus]